MTRAWAIALCVLAGCAQLPDVASDSCGNHVVEAGEECDGTPGCGDPSTQNECQYVCATDGTGCPTGWGCGTDQRCRRPTETFELTTVETMPAAGATTVDMDGDGIADLLGYDSRGLVMRFGDADGLFAASTRVPAPFTDTTPCTPNIDGKGPRDLAVPLADTGWALFAGDGARGLTPMAQDAISLNFPGCDKVTAGALRTDPSSAPEMMIVLGGKFVAFIGNDECAGSSDCVVSVAGGDLLDNTIRTAPLGYGVLDGVVPDAEQFTMGVVGAQQVSVWGTDRTAHRPKRVASYLLPEPIADGGHVWFGDVTGDACPDLVIDDGTGLFVAESKTSLGACVGLAGALTPVPRPLGTLLALGDITHDGVDEILYSNAGGVNGGGGPTMGGGEVDAYVHDLATGTWSTLPHALFATTDTPIAAAILDYNRDGWGDIALVSSGTTTVDMYLNYDLQAFDRFPVDVGGQPRTPVVGDFDGDLEEDVVVSVADPVDPTADDSAYIIYGDPSGRPSTAQYLGDFVEVATPARVAGGAQGGTDSVVVSSNDIAADGQSCDRRLAVLIGDTSRQLVSPYVLVYDDGSGGGPRAVLPIGSVDVSTPGAPAVLAIGDLPPADPTTGTDQLLVSMLTFDGYSYVKSAVGAVVPSTLLPPYYAYGAHWKTGAIHAGETDALSLVYDKAVILRNSATMQTADVFDLPAQLQYSSWFDLVDIDGDGDPDVVGMTGGGTPQPLAGPGTGGEMWMVQNDGGHLDFSAMKMMALPDSLYCFDAGAIHSQDNGTPQPIGACYYQGASESGPVVVIGTMDSGSTDLTNVRMIHLDSDLAGVQVGDYTGDGLDDIAVLSGTSVSLYRQCTDEEVTRGDPCVAPAPLP